MEVLLSCPYNVSIMAFGRIDVSLVPYAQALKQDQALSKHGLGHDAHAH